LRIVRRAVFPSFAGDFAFRRGAASRDVKILSEKIARFREKIAGIGLPPH
jgi:hypothetical protein